MRCEEEKRSLNIILLLFWPAQWILATTMGFVFTLSAVCSALHNGERAQYAVVERNCNRFKISGEEEM